MRTNKHETELDLWHYNCLDCTYTFEIAEIEEEMIKNMGLQDPHEFQQAMFKAAQSGDPRYGELKSVYDVLYPAEAKKRPLTSVQQTLITNTESALRAIDKVEGILDQDPNMLLKATGPGIIGRLAGASTYNTARKEIADVIGRLRTGAVINDEEMRTYLGKVPELGDRPEDIQYKINEMRNIFDSLKQRIQMQSGAAEYLPIME